MNIPKVIHIYVYIYIISLCRYEDEINKRAAAENEFVLLKKVLKSY